jgi:hypothetical protein
VEEGRNEFVDDAEGYTLGAVGIITLDSVALSDLIDIYCVASLSY